MPPRNLLLSIALGTLATLAHPFAFAAKAASAAGASLGGPALLRLARRAREARPRPMHAGALEAARVAALREALRGLFRGGRVSGGPCRRGAGGVSINLYEQGAGHACVLVQCRPWTAHRVGIKPVRALRGAMASHNGRRRGRDLGQVHAGSARPRRPRGRQADRWRRPAGKIAALVPEKARALHRLATQGDFMTPTCPSCAIKMISRRSTAQGRRYWGCRNYPACKQTFFEAV